MGFTFCSVEQENNCALGTRFNGCIFVSVSTKSCDMGLVCFACLCVCVRVCVCVYVLAFDHFLSVYIFSLESNCKDMNLD